MEASCYVRPQQSARTLCNEKNEHARQKIILVLRVIEEITSRQPLQNPQGACTSKLSILSMHKTQLPFHPR